MKRLRECGGVSVSVCVRDAICVGVSESVSVCLCSDCGGVRAVSFV